MSSFDVSFLESLPRPSQFGVEKKFKTPKEALASLRAKKRAAKREADKIRLNTRMAEDPVFRRRHLDKRKATYKKRRTKDLERRRLEYATKAKNRAWLEEENRKARENYAARKARKSK